MSEYWKSTPTYWCKHCTTYVRDTPVSKRQHESTPRHQGNIQRSLRTLHKTHEREERDKSRAKAEVDRLNGIVSGTSGAKSASRGSNATAPRAFGSAQARVAREDAKTADPAERKRQALQLAALGVAVPDEYRKELALAGEWETIATRTVPEEEEPALEPDAKSFGVRKRKLEDGEEDEAAEAGANGQAGSRPERQNMAWGSRMKTWKSEESELDIASLMGGTSGASRAKEESSDKTQDIKREETGDAPVVRTEDEPETPVIKREDSLPEVSTPAAAEGQDPPVLFKKRKNKALKT